ncbi:hypothetical protein [Moorena sp. SIO4G3]|uniref:hypothetical protein n=1 Tax=Moorena sp. SIO4G3 TaxID=2607821 RepID=UPI001429B75C|nr:hypothetical protein [Moorena sp. SIO4G3]NEO75681.1 hypothetical protein [Moorena sp. SIO4G3]
MAKRPRYANGHALGFADASALERSHLSNQPGYLQPWPKGHPTEPANLQPMADRGALRNRLLYPDGSAKNPWEPLPNPPYGFLGKACVYNNRYKPPYLIANKTSSHKFSTPSSYGSVQHHHRRTTPPVSRPYPIAGI